MKKFRGTKHAHIGTTYTPSLDAAIAAVEKAVLDQQARLDDLAQQVAALIGEDIDLTRWGE